MPLLAESKRSVALRAKRAASPNVQRSKTAIKATSAPLQSSCVFCRTPFASKSKAPLVTTASLDILNTSNRAPVCSSPPTSPLTRSAKNAQQTYFGLNGRADRVLSMHFTPFARIVRCGHLICYPCAVAHGATTGRNDCEGLQPSIATCPCCLRESSVDLCRKVRAEDLTNPNEDKFSFRWGGVGSAVTKPYPARHSDDVTYPSPTVRIATIEELRARYLALRLQQSQKLQVPHQCTEVPVSILKKDGYRTPEPKGRCVFDDSPLRTPSTEPMGVTPLTHSPAITIAHSPSTIESSPTPVCILEGTENDLQLPSLRECSFVASNLRRHSFVGGHGISSLSLSDSKRTSQARNVSCPSPYDLIFLANLHPKRLHTLPVLRHNAIENDSNSSPVDEDDRSTLIAASSSPLVALSSPRRDMSRDLVKMRRLTRMQLWIGELQGDGPSPSLCTSARSHRSLASARSERSTDLPLLLRSLSEGRCAIEECDDTAVPVTVEGIEEMACEVLFPCN